MENSYEKKRPQSDFDIHKTGTKIFKIENLFPYSFVPVQKDCSSKEWGKMMHSDGAGSKPIQNYLHWKETGDISAFEWVADDVVAMNLNDVFCVMANPDVEFVDYVAINRFKIPKDGFLEALNRGFKRIFGSLKEYGINVSWLGGETAEVSDQVRTIDVSGTVRAKVKLKDAITGGMVAPGDAIIGLGSYGKAAWEKKENSGIMSNGITVVRHCLMLPQYAEKYPEIADPGTSEYNGRFKTGQYLEKLKMTVGEAIISPTRIFAPALKLIIEKYGSKNIHGIIHNTGGGLTKILRIGKNIHYIKNNLLPIPPIFPLIQKESGRSWNSVFEGLNNGIGIEIMAPQNIASNIVKDIEEFNIPASVIGYCEANKNKEKLSTFSGNRLTIISKRGSFEYPYEKFN